MARLNNQSNRFGTSSPVHYTTTIDASTGAVTIPVTFEERAQEIPLQLQEGFEELPIIIQEFYRNLGSCQILYGTVEYWNSQPNLFSRKNTVYVYTDRSVIQKEGRDVYVPGLKIGLENVYLINVPFIDEYNISILQNHIDDNVRHINTGERESWNNKITVREPEDGSLIFDY